MGKRGPKPKYGTPELLQEAVDKYFKECEEQGDTFPDYAGMCIFLGLTKKRLEDIGASSDEYNEILETAKLKREMWLSRKMAEDNKKAQGCMNNLKQPQNGGYIDRPIENKTSEIKINLVGVGGESAFK